MSHQRNAEVARTFVHTQQTKGWFMAKAQQIAVWTSGAMMSIGIILWYTGVKLEISVETGLKLLASIPIVVVVVIFACFVEGMVITSASGKKEVEEKVEQELERLRKSKNKYPEAYTDEEYAKEEKKIKSQLFVPLGIMIGFSSFSFLGGELFWSKMLEGSGNFFIQCIGYIMGGAICVGLIYLETHPELIERGVDRAISSSHLIYQAMNMDAKGQVLDALAKSREEKLKSPEFTKVIDETAQTSLYAPLAESIQAMGSSVSEEQLMYQVQGKIAARASANQLAQGLEEADRDTDELSVISSRRRTNYNTKQQKRCREIILKYGHGMVSQDIDKFAKEAKVARATMVAALERRGA